MAALSLEAVNLSDSDQSFLRQILSAVFKKYPKENLPQHWTGVYKSDKDPVS